MMQGDQYALPMAINTMDGAPIDLKDVEEIEVSFSCSVKKLLSNGGIVYDKDSSSFLIYLSQKDTFLMRGKIKTIVRVKFLSGDVMGKKIEIDDVEESISKVVL